MVNHAHDITCEGCGLELRRVIGGGGVLRHVRSGEVSCRRRRVRRLSNKRLAFLGR